jgi:hypothetical protein
MSEAMWIATTLRLPADGQQVLVKTRYGTVEHRVTFRVKPWPRWETPSLISDLELYAFWKPTQSGRIRAANESHASL